MIRLETRLLSSLVKARCADDLTAPEFTSASALPGETFSFQLALRNTTPRPLPGGGVAENLLPRTATVEVRAESALPVELRSVEEVPVTIPGLRTDGWLIDSRPGLYPDRLAALPDGLLRLPGNLWRFCWVTLRIPADCAPGAYPVTLKLREFDLAADAPAAEGETREFTFDLRVAGAAPAPAAEFIRFEWFHHDCLCRAYGVECWSEEHWRIFAEQLRNAAVHGLNMLFTPLWTPPLDTAVGGERPTVQLLGITRRGDRYEFDFSRLERYVEVARSVGISRFSMSHAFTQWGATATPKIVATVEDGSEQRIFGWNVPADSPAYAGFLRQLMPPLLAFFRERGLGDRIYFSVSDEPSEKNLETYAFASKLLHSFLDGVPTLDALSNYEIYERGLVDTPVPADDHIEKFVGKVPKLFTYYCISQEAEVPNRFIAMPAIRTRIFGVLCYLYRVVGFLHWGYNFYNSQYSHHPVDPYRDSCADNWGPGGDGFIVYPGVDGAPEDSIRHELFYEAIQDYRACSAAEAKIGRDAVEKLILEGLDYRPSMTRYPRENGWLLDLRERLNRVF